MSAIDVYAQLEEFAVTKMDPLQRILLVTDGTVTEILEATFLERIQLIKVFQKLAPANASHAQFNADRDETLLERRIFLRGSRSGRNYAYAESVIAVDRLGTAFRNELVESDTPLGKLWLEHRIETFKELVGVRCRAANELSRDFGCQKAAPLLIRSYRVFSNNRPVMIITEYFPATYAKSDARDPDLPAPTSAL
jgi:chorismate-pyruvate lyase